MHELSIAAEIVKYITEVCARENAERVLSVTVHVGEISGIEGSALEMAFPFAAEDTPVSGAELVIKKIPVGVYCRSCGNNSNPEIPLFVCGACGSKEVEIKSGRDLIIQTVRLE